VLLVSHSVGPSIILNIHGKSTIILMTLYTYRSLDVARVLERAVNIVSVTSVCYELCKSQV